MRSSIIGLAAVVVTVATAQSIPSCTCCPIDINVLERIADCALNNRRDFMYLELAPSKLQFESILCVIDI